MNKLIFALIDSVAAAAAFTFAVPDKVHAQGNCVTLTDNQTFANGCNRRVTVVWVDQGSCSTGCSDTIDAEDYTRITPIRGRVCWTVGWGNNYPGVPRC
jgi:hypothetical protein